MFQFFKSKSTNLLGIDLSVNAIRITELATSKKGICLKNYEIEYLEPSNPENKLEAIIEKMNPSTKNVAFAMPYTEVFTKKMFISADIGQKELPDYIQLEAKQFVPYSFNELYFDYHIMGQDTSEGHQRDVLFVACRKADLEKRLQWIETAGLNVKVVDVDIYAIERAYAAMRPYLKTKILGIIDINPHKLRLLIFKENRISSFYEETIKVEQSLREVFIKIINSYEASNEQISLIHLMLSGDAAMCLALKEEIQRLGEEDIKVVDTFLGMNCSDKVLSKTIKKDAPEMIISCGLALRTC